MSRSTRSSKALGAEAVTTSVPEQSVNVGSAETPDMPPGHAEGVEDGGIVTRKSSRGKSQPPKKDGTETVVSVPRGAPRGRRGGRGRGRGGRGGRGGKRNEALENVMEIVSQL
jgi:hypothetical protein